MTDHDRFRLLAAADVDGRLTPDEILDLEAHLATCSTCRAEATRLKRDHQLLVAGLIAEPVSPRVRVAVSRAASGRRQANPWPLLAAAALLTVSLLGVVLLAGGSTSSLVAIATPSPTADPVVTPDPASGPPTEAPATTRPTASPAATPAPAVAIVNGVYRYTIPSGATRQDAVAARGGDVPSGTWSRLIPGSDSAMGGTITCLVVDGADAWMAGPATTWTGGASAEAVMLYVHDGGPDGSGDRAVLWATDPGQTLETMESWCEGRYIPGDAFPLDSGDVAVTAP